MSILKKKKSVFESLLDIQNNPDLQNKLTVLQNEINSFNDTTVTAIASIRNDKLSAYFAKAVADAYAVNKLKTLIIDTNMYEPSLLPILNINEQFQEKKKGFEISEELGCFKVLNEMISAICLNKQVYPSNVFKGETIKKWIENGKKEFDHVLVILPSVKEHKEILLLRESITSIVLVVERNIDVTKDIFDFSEFCNENILPQVKTILIK